MFFDKVQRADDSKRLLREIACEQQRLFLAGEWVESSALLQMREELLAVWRSQGRFHHTGWWDVPWNQVAAKLREDTRWQSGEDRDGWQWEWTLEGRQEQQTCLVYLKLHGRKEGGTVVEEEWNRYEKSRYSASERSDMVSDYNRKINQWELVGLAASDGPVYSELSGKSYDSMGSYLFSADHFVLRSLCSDIYEQSLYTTHEVHNMRIQSNNRHFYGLYRVAELHMNSSGVVDVIRPGRLELLASQGEALPTGQIQGILTEKDPLLMTAGYLMEKKRACSVAAELLCGALDQDAGTLENAIRQAELVTCLAHTITHT